MLEYTSFIHMHGKPRSSKAQDKAMHSYILMHTYLIFMPMEFHMDEEAVMKKRTCHSSYALL